jgi:hypothetical protein
MYKWHGNGHEQYGLKWKAGDIITCCIDLDRCLIEFHLNGVPMGVAYEFGRNEIEQTIQVFVLCYIVFLKRHFSAENERSLIQWKYFSPGVSMDQFQHLIFNFGQSPFKYVNAETTTRTAAATEFLMKFSSSLFPFRFPPKDYSPVFSLYSPKLLQQQVPHVPIQQLPAHSSSPLHWALFQPNLQQKTAKIGHLLQAFQLQHPQLPVQDAGIYDERGFSLVDLCCELPNVPPEIQDLILHFLSKYGNSLSLSLLSPLVDQHEESSRHSLFCAAFVGNFPVFHSLIQRYPKDVVTSMTLDVNGDIGWNLLETACLRGHSQIIKFLVENFDFTNASGFPLQRVAPSPFPFWSLLHSLKCLGCVVRC